MRMWMVDPAIMCRKHLLGEHVELHMFVGSFKKGISIDGYINNNLLELKEVNNRHDTLADEMVRRGYNHKSPLEQLCLCLMFCAKYWVRRIDRASALNDLISRCPECAANYKRSLK